MCGHTEYDFWSKRKQVYDVFFPDFESDDTSFYESCYEHSIFRGHSVFVVSFHE